MNDSSRTSLSRLIGPAVALLALIAYLVTLSDGAYPGESAHLIVRHTGLFPITTPSHPVWHSFVWVLARVPIGSVVWRLNVFSALCGGLAAWLLYEVVKVLLGLMGREQVVPRRRRNAAGYLGGAAAALFFAFSMPFWFASNKAHTGSFDILLLLSATLIFMRFFVTDKRRYLFLFAFVFGVGITEFATFIVLAPLFGVALLIYLWQGDRLRVGLVAQVVGCSLAGMLIYAAAALAFVGSPGYVMQGHTGFFGVLWIVWRNQYWLIVRSLPKVGWLVVLMLTVLPWAGAMMVSRRGLNRERDWAFYILHVVLLVPTWMVLTNHQIAPWSMLGTSALLVTPYILSAVAYGYLAAYWYLFDLSLRGRGESSSGKVSAFSTLMPRVAGLVFLAPVLVMPFLNFRGSDARDAGVVNRYAAGVIASLEGREWLVTDGVADNHLLIAADQAGTSVRLLNLRAGQNETYMGHIAGFLESPRLRNLANLGMLRLLQGWLESDPDVTESMAILSYSDLWLGAGFEIVPNRLLYLGAENASRLDADDIMARHERFWEEELPGVLGESAEDDDAAPYRSYAARLAGTAANNLGVLMEDLERPKNAVYAYQAAKRIDPSNISAMLNLNNLADEGLVAEEDAEGIRAELAALKSNPDQKYEVWSLSRTYGYVRSPEAYSRLGMTWVGSGQRKLAVRGLKKAMAFLPDDRQQGVKQALAQVYLLDDRDQESEALCRELLAEDPRNQRALLGMTRIALRRADFTEAEQWLSKASDAGVSGKIMALERTALYLAMGETERAKAVIEEMLELDPEMDRGWVLLATVCMAQDDEDGLAECLRKLRTFEDGQVFVDAIRAQQAESREDWDTAAEHLERARALRPGNIEMLARLARVRLIQGQAGEAVEHARSILLLDPDNSFANYVLGAQQTRELKFDLAEDSLRKSLEDRRSVYALNDLAWLLQHQQKFEEAEPLIREALELQPGLYTAWDTLGEILAGTGRLKDAAEALDRSVSLFTGDLSVYLHLAEVQARLGNKPRAEEIMALLQEKRNRLTPENQDKLSEIRRLVDAM